MDSILCPRMIILATLLSVSFVFHDTFGLAQRYPSIVERVRWLICLSS